MNASFNFLNASQAAANYCAMAQLQLCNAFKGGSSIALALMGISIFFLLMRDRFEIDNKYINSTKLAELMLFIMFLYLVYVRFLL